LGGTRRGRGSWYHNGEDLPSNSEDHQPQTQSEEANLSPTLGRGRGGARRGRGTSYRNGEDQVPPPPTEDEWPSLAQS